MEIEEKIIRNMIGGIWKTASIDEEPEIVLRGGKIMEVTSPFYEGRTRHFYGYSIHGFEGRASTPIIMWDPNTRTGKTQSGRVYKLLEDKMRFSEMGDAEYVWSFMIRRDEMTDIVDVTEECLNGSNIT